MKVRNIDIQSCDNSSLHRPTHKFLSWFSLFCCFYLKVWSKIQILGQHGGSISAEHGVGFKKAKQIHYSRSPEAIEVMRKLKHVMDPKVSTFFLFTVLLDFGKLCEGLF